MGKKRTNWKLKYETIASDIVRDLSFLEMDFSRNTKALIQDTLQHLIRKYKKNI